MSVDTAAAMLADLIGAAGFAHVLAPPAKAANPANREHRRGAWSGAATCEGLRNAAKAAPDSQEFASHRNMPDGLQRKQTSGLSQDSQDSQRGGPQARADLALVVWTDADIAAFTTRRARLLRWGWDEAEAERLAERLVMRDRSGDDRASCIECKHGRPWRCGQSARAGLHAPELGRDLAGLLQRCPAFELQG